MFRKILVSLAAGLAVMTMAATANAQLFGGGKRNSNNTADVQLADDLERLIAESYRQVPLPGITNFFERRMVRMLYELRDNPEYRTYTYITTLDGRFVKVCDSVGFGINASIQFSNPEKPVDLEDILGWKEGNSQTTIPQAEPNGLFMPEGLAATYAMCLNPVDGEIAPVYLEQEITVSPFPLN